LNSIIPILIFIVLMRMRVPTNDSIIINSRVRYQLIDFGQGEIVRNAIEYGLNNRRIFIQDTIYGIRWFYVDSKDFKNLWPEPPFDMRAKNYTIKAKFKVDKLLFGGYSKATVIEYEKINDNPMITK
jgi:hypothetical protein